LLLPLLNLLFLAVLVALLSRSARAAEVPSYVLPDPFFSIYPPDHAISLDLLLFSQFDNGGNPLVAEGFRYEGLMLDVRMRESDQVYTRGTAVVAYLQNDPLMTLPPNVTNAHVTSASVDFVTLDAALTVDVTSPDRNWVISPGVFYHHQWAYLAGGVDLEVRRILAGGDTTLRLAYAGRYAELSQAHWDGSAIYDDTRLTNNYIFGWTQILSPHLVTYLGLQYTRQSGLLYSTLQFVGLENPDGQITLVNEVLPRLRNRGQVSARVRYTPSVGTSLGLDASFYDDDWGLKNVAAEPNFETPVFHGARLRLWYMLSKQWATRYFIPHPMVAQQYMTQNSNLGTFLYHGPGLWLMVPLNTGPGLRWMVRGSVLGFYRTDNIWGLGGSLGVVTEW
jgi:hypothetical protein